VSQAARSVRERSGGVISGAHHGRSTTGSALGLCRALYTVDFILYTLHYWHRPWLVSSSLYCRLYTLYFTLLASPLACVELLLGVGGRVRCSILARDDGASVPRAPAVMLGRGMLCAGCVTHRETRASLSPGMSGRAFFRASLPAFLRVFCKMSNVGRKGSSWCRLLLERNYSKAC